MEHVEEGDHQESGWSDDIEDWCGCVCMTSAFRDKACRTGDR